MGFFSKKNDDKAEITPINVKEYEFNLKEVLKSLKKIDHLSAHMKTIYNLSLSGGGSQAHMPFNLQDMKNIQTAIKILDEGWIDMLISKYNVLILEDLFSDAVKEIAIDGKIYNYLDAEDLIDEGHTKDEAEKMQEWFSGYLSQYLTDAYPGKFAIYTDWCIHVVPIEKATQMFKSVKLEKMVCQ